MQRHNLTAANEALLIRLADRYARQRREEGLFDRLGERFLEPIAPPNINPDENGVFSQDFVIQQDINLRVRVYRRHEAVGAQPDVRRPLSTEFPVPVMIFFHGGSFCHSSYDTAMYDELCRHMVVVCRCVVVSVNYRCAPDHKYPSAYLDGLTALGWVNTQEWFKSGSGRDRKARIYLVGDSSGGNIVHNVAIMNINQRISVPVMGNILINPVFGGEERVDSEIALNGRFFATLEARDWYWNAFLPEGSDRDHPACNPFGRGRTLRGIKFPKTMIIVSEYDMLVDRQRAYADELEKTEQKYLHIFLPRATVGFYLLRDNYQFHRVMEEIGAFISYDSQEVPVSYLYLDR